MLTRPEYMSKSEWIVDLIERLIETKIAEDQHSYHRPVEEIKEVLETALKEIFT